MREGESLRGRIFIWHRFGLLSLLGLFRFFGQYLLGESGKIDYSPSVKKRIRIGMVYKAAKRPTTITITTAQYFRHIGLS